MMDKYQSLLLRIIIQKIEDIRNDALKKFYYKLKEKFTEEFCGQKYDLIHSWIDEIFEEVSL